MRTMMVKAAPRFATILCLCDVSLGHACPCGRGQGTSGWAAGGIVSGVHSGESEEEGKRREWVGGGQVGRTLAMPMGDSDSAMAKSWDVVVLVVLVVVVVMMDGWRDA